MVSKLDYIVILKLNFLLIIYFIYKVRREEYLMSLALGGILSQLIGEYLSPPSSSTINTHGITISN